MDRHWGEKLPGARWASISDEVERVLGNIADNTRNQVSKPT